jgi:outer membrane protein OmpA-like peptidoglycan-associated protein
MKKRILVSALGAALAAAPSAQAQTGSVSVSGDQDNTRMAFYGDDTRFGLGIDDDGDLLGELYHVLSADHESAWITEAWYNRKAGGLKLSYHWVPGEHDVDSLAENGDSLRVWKAFGAVDQNRERDRKVTLGGGFEQNNYFFGAYYSHGITGERFVDSSTLVTERLIQDFLDGRPFQQLETTTTVTSVFEQAYDHGVGVRLGRFFDQSLWRVRGGLDYETGDFDSDQFTVSLGVEKFIANTAHSFELRAEHLEKSGDFEIDDSDTRASLTWRYSFGQIHRPAVRYEEVPVERMVASKTTDTRVIRNEAEVETNTFFAFDSTDLRSEAEAELQDLAARIGQQQLLGQVSIVGHTCDIGSVSYNQGLSMRRAKAVYDKLIALGVPADRLNFEGRGESQPLVPNTSDDNRERNRRVNIDFITIEERSEDIEPEPKTELVMERREVAQAPAWLQRALRNPIQHKREVDVYRIEREESTTSLGEIEFLNRVPEANNFATEVIRNTATFIDVLENASDADDDVLTVSSVTQAANGEVTNFGDFVEYTPADGFLGEDSFTYTVSDDQGGEATATVTITVVDNGPEASDIQVETLFGEPIEIDVLELGVESASEATLTSVGTALNGSAEIVNGQVRYQPAVGFVGEDSFTYTVESDAGSDTATVTVTVQAIAPTAGDIQLESGAGEPVSVDVLNFVEAGIGGVLSLQSVGDAANGSVSIDGNRVTYTPNSGFRGQDVFTYTVTEAGGLSATGNISVNVTDTPNRAPVANTFLQTTDNTTDPVVADVLANVSDPDGDPLTLVSISDLPNPVIGTVEMNDDGTVTFTPGNGWSGREIRFTYTVSDGRGGEASAQVRILCL